MNARLRRAAARTGASLLGALAVAAFFGFSGAPSASSGGDPLLETLKALSSGTVPPPTMIDPAGTPSGSRGVPAGRPQTVGVRIAAQPAVPPAKRLNVLNWNGFRSRLLPAVGRIWVIRAGEAELIPYCTGTVVTRTLVVTAGHCVVNADTNGVHPYHTRILFVPGQTWNDPQSTTLDDIRAPWGVWEARAWWTPRCFREDTCELDWGLIEIAPKNGQFIGDVVGSWPIRYNVRFNDGAHVYSVGYPAEGFWQTVRGHEGRGQYACDDTWRGGAWLPVSGGGYDVWIKCPMNGGASGGPWFVQLAAGSWVIAGVNNWCNDDNTSDDEPGTYCTPVSSDMRSFIFDGRFGVFWNSVLPHLHY